jgi:hypothetical protein
MHSKLRNKEKWSRIRPQPCTIKGKEFQGSGNQNVPTQDVRHLFEMKSEQNLLNTSNIKSMSTQTAISIYKTVSCFGLAPFSRG